MFYVALTHFRSYRDKRNKDEKTLLTGKLEITWRQERRNKRVGKERNCKNGLMQCLYKEQMHYTRIFNVPGEKTVHGHKRPGKTEECSIEQATKKKEGKNRVLEI